MCVHSSHYTLESERWFNIIKYIKYCDSDAIRYKVIQKNKKVFKEKNIPFKIIKWFDQLSTF